MKLNRHISLPLQLGSAVLITQSSLNAQTYSAWSASQSWPASYTTEQKSLFADPDRDGQTNLREYVTGSTPFTYGPLHQVLYTQNGAVTTLTFTERASHYSALSYIRIINTLNRIYAIPVPATATRIVNPGNSALVNISFSISDVIQKAELVTLQTTKGQGLMSPMQEPANVVCVYEPVGAAGAIRLNWEDCSWAETSYGVDRLSYDSSGSLVSATTLTTNLTADSTTFLDTSASILTNGNFYSYRVYSRRTDPYYGAPYIDSSNYSDYAMIKYSTNANGRDSDCDFVPDAYDSYPQNPFDPMESTLGSPSWSFGGASPWTVTVRKNPGPGEYSTINSALASTSNPNVVIQIYPGTYTENISISRTKNIYLKGIPTGIAPNNRIVLKASSTGVNLLLNQGGVFCQNITFKGINASTKHMVSMSGSDVFVRSAFENCIFTEHTNGAYSPVGVAAGRNRFSHCTFVGNSTVADGGYIKAQGLTCSNTMPHNIVENSIFYNSGSEVTVYAPEITDGFRCEASIIRGEQMPEAACIGCFSDNPGLVSNNYVDLYSRSRNMGIPLGIQYDIDGEPRKYYRPDLGADEWLDQDRDNIADILYITTSRDKDGDHTLNGDEITNRWNTTTFSPISNSAVFPPTSNPTLNLQYVATTNSGPNNPFYVALGYGGTTIPTGSVTPAEHVLTATYPTSNIYRKLLIGDTLELMFQTQCQYGTLSNGQWIYCNPHHVNAVLGNGLFFTNSTYSYMSGSGSSQTLQTLGLDYVTAAQYGLISVPSANDPTIKFNFDRAYGVSGQLRISGRGIWDGIYTDVATVNVTGGSSLLIFNNINLEDQIGRGHSLADYTDYDVVWVVEGVAILPSDAP